MTLEGGIRDRMIFQSVMNHIVAGLESKGWFDEIRAHKPIKVIDAYPGDTEAVEINTLAFSVGDSFQTMLELGSNGETHTLPVYADFYGEADGITRHILGDMYLQVNKFPVIPVYDYDMATPTVDFYVQVVEESVEKSYPPRATNPWQKHWGILTLMVEDDRTNA